MSVFCQFVFIVSSSLTSTQIDSKLNASFSAVQNTYAAKVSAGTFFNKPIPGGAFAGTSNVNKMSIGFNRTKTPDSTQTSSAPNATTYPQTTAMAMNSTSNAPNATTYPQTTAMAMNSTSNGTNSTNGTSRLLLAPMGRGMGAVLTRTVLSDLAEIHYDTVNGDVTVLNKLDSSLIEVEINEFLVNEGAVSVKFEWIMTLDSE